jgi:hypothetical protein
MSVYQISVFLENRAGQLADITGILAQEHIDMRALTIAEASDYGVLRLIVDDAEKTANILLNHGYIVSMTPVTVIAVPDRPGGLAEVLAIMKEGDIDIEYMYAMSTKTIGTAYMVFRISDETKFSALLEKHDLQAVMKAELGLK